MAFREFNLTRGSRGWLVRLPSDADRRVKLLHVTPAGEQLMRDMSAAVDAAQRRILAPLSMPKQAQFMAMLAELVEKNNDLSRAPIPGED